MDASAGGADSWDGLGAGGGLSADLHYGCKDEDEDSELDSGQ